MFWVAFISIVLFIVFLVTILVSTGRTSTNKTLRSLKDELEEKNRALEAKKAASAQKFAVPPKAPTSKPKIEESPEVAKVAAVSVPVAEEVVSTIEETVIAEEAIPEKKEVVEETEEAAPIASVELPFIEEETTTENVPAVEEAVEEPEPQEQVTEIETELSFVEEALSVPEAEEAVEEVLETVPEPTPEVIVEEEPVVEESVPEELIEEEPVVEVAVEEAYDYPEFDNTRTMEEFGLPKEEADEFIVDLIQQVEEEMPNLEDAVTANDSHKIEEISHMIKGSATNLGTGGIADVLVDFNTYMKTDSNPAVIALHMNNLRRALQELKRQFQ